MTETRRMVPEPATPHAIAAYGTLIEAGEDGTPFGPADAALELGRGTPRLYIMRLTQRPLTIRGITRHQRVTQCLAAMKGQEWFVLLAPPDAPDDADARPDPARMRAFRISGGQAIALHRGTWHAGPYFAAPEVDFLNLELSDTNETDHHTVNLDAEFGFTVALEP
jgi:ureidoglycolate hydrolase